MCFALISPPVTVLGYGLVTAPPQQPAEQMIKHYAGSMLEAADEMVTRTRSPIKRRGTE
jgi:hypothetical protein